MAGKGERKLISEFIHHDRPAINYLFLISGQLKFSSLQKSSLLPSDLSQLDKGPGKLIVLMAIREGVAGLGSGLLWWPWDAIPLITQVTADPTKPLLLRVSYSGPAE